MLFQDLIKHFPSRSMWCQTWHFQRQRQTAWLPPPPVLTLIGEILFVLSLSSEWVEELICYSHGSVKASDGEEHIEVEQCCHALMFNGSDQCSPVGKHLSQSVFWSSHDLIKHGRDNGGFFCILGSRAVWQTGGTDGCALMWETGETAVRLVSKWGREVQKHAWEHTQTPTHILYASFN